MYIYLGEKDNFDAVPQEVLKNLGRVDFAMELELSAEKKLASEEPRQVMENLEKHGFHIQMPKNTPTDELLENIARQMTESAKDK
jgi:uncharacterized protein YcgL (UPF0745 family)